MVAGYRIEGLIGRGGMGAVYRAVDVRLGRRVALKLLAPELAENERFRQRFLRESQLAASLDHPNIVAIYQAGDEDGALFLAMRYVEGIDLGKLVAQEGVLDPSRAAALVEQVAGALDAAHLAGLVHRDVKPSNILVVGSGSQEHCYLADFGLARQTSSISGASEPGQVVGTLEYIAPEQIRGGEIDGRADVYSLACVLYECLTGAPPFERATDVALLWAHVHEPPPALTARRTDLRRGLDTVAARALAKEPDRRYATSGEFAAAVRAVHEPATPARPRRLQLALTALAALLVGVLIAVILALRSGSSGLTAVSVNAVGVIDPQRNKLVGEVPVGIGPEAVAVGQGSVWVANVEDQTVSRIDPATRSLVHTISVGEYPSDVAVGAGSVWVALGSRGKLSRISPRGNDAAPPVPGLEHRFGNRTCGESAASIAVSAEAVWFACRSAAFGRLDLRTGKVSNPGYESGLLTSPVAVAPEFADVAFGLGSVWIVNRSRNRVTQLDPATSRTIQDFVVGKAPSAVAVGVGSVWVANFGDDTVTRIEAPPNAAPTLTRIPVGDGPVDVAAAKRGGDVWVANAGDRTVQRIDAESNEVVATVGVGNEPQRIAVGDGAVWVTARAPGRRAVGS